jgi:type IV pilus assembly protein PilF
MRHFGRLAWMGLIAAMLAACASSASREQVESEARLVDIYTNLAAEQLSLNKLDIALQEIEKALAVDSRNSRANAVMGLIQARLRDDRQAERYLRRAISYDENNAEARNAYGVFLCERDRLQDALKQFDAAIANPLYRAPERPNVNAGVCLMKKPRPVEAEKYFRAALRANPKSPVALYNMARISYDGGQALSARAFMQRYFEATSDSPEALLLAVKIERALRAKDAEASYALRLRGKFPESAEAKELQALSGKSAPQPR